MPAFRILPRRNGGIRRQLQRTIMTKPRNRSGFNQDDVALARFFFSPRFGGGGGQDAAALPWSAEGRLRAVPGSGERLPRQTVKFSQ
jgi:hypothetical protein